MPVPAEIRGRDATFVVRRAVRDDVDGLVALLAADPLGASRGDSTDDGQRARYLAAFDEVDANPQQLLVAVTTGDGTIVGTLQLTVVPGLSRRGTRRAQLEAVHVDAAHRGSGCGGALVRWAVEEARERGCGLVELTSAVSRHDAHRFYARLGFEHTHHGMKRDLTTDG